MHLSDSIQTQHTVSSVEEGGELLMKVDSTVGKFRHPYQILRTLPKNATPAQQDSAIQAAFQPGEIHYSNRPDTLRLPGEPLGKSVYEVSIPQYYKETYFTSDSLMHPELNGGRMGIAGDPIPYLVSNDSVMTGVLLAFVILTILVVSRSMRFIAYQFKNFMYPGHSYESIEYKETAGEVNYQFFLCFQTVVLFSLSCYYCLVDSTTETYVVDTYQLLGLFFLSVFGIFMLKELFYVWANWTFFSSHQIGESVRTRLFLTSFEGVLLLPIVLLYTFFGLPTNILLISTAFVILFVKILSFYKVYRIFFQRKAYFLQFFLYFCTLEIVPLAILGGVLMLIGKLLKITY